MRIFVVSLGCKHDVEVKLGPDDVLPPEVYCQECGQSSARIAFAESSIDPGAAPIISRTAPGGGKAKISKGE